MATLLIASLVCTALLLVAFLFLDGHVYRVLRRLWASRIRERLLSFANEFPVHEDTIVFIGDTHLADFRWEEHFDKDAVRNLGIPDETVAELNQRLPAIVSNTPRLILLHCGGTDVRLGYRAKTIVTNVEHTLSTISEGSPNAAVIIVGIFPQQARQATKIEALNQKFAELAVDHGYAFIETFADLADPAGGLSPSYSDDGYHLSGMGYEQILNKVRAQL